MEPVAVGVEGGLNKIIVDRQLPVSSNTAASVPRSALHCNELHIARIAAVPKERMTILVEEVDRGLGIMWIVINCAAWVMPMKMVTRAQGGWRNTRRASVLGEVKDKLIEWHAWWRYRHVYRHANLRAKQ